MFGGTCWHNSAGWESSHRHANVSYEHLWQLAALQEDGETVAPRVLLVDLQDLGRVVLQVEVQPEGPPVPIQVLPVVPHTVEAQHLRHPLKVFDITIRVANASTMSYPHNSLMTACGALPLTCLGCEQNQLALCQGKEAYLTSPQAI